MHVFFGYEAFYNWLSRKCTNMAFQFLLFQPDVGFLLQTLYNFCFSLNSKIPYAFQAPNSLNLRCLLQHTSISFHTVFITTFLFVLHSPRCRSKFEIRRASPAHHAVIRVNLTQPCLQGVTLRVVMQRCGRTFRS